MLYVHVTQGMTRPKKKADHLNNVSPPQLNTLHLGGPAHLHSTISSQTATTEIIRSSFAFIETYSLNSLYSCDFLNIVLTNFTLALHACNKTDDLQIL